MAEVDPTQEKLKKYEKAVKKLKAANDKAAKELTTQKSTFDAALAEKSALVESLKAAAEGAKEDGGGGDGLQEKVEEQEEKIKEGEENVKKMEENMKLQEAATKDKLETQKTKLETEWKKKFEEAQLNAGAPKKEKKGSSDEVPNDYIPGFNPTGNIIIWNFITAAFLLFFRCPGIQLRLFKFFLPFRLEFCFLSFKFVFGCGLLKLHILFHLFYIFFPFFDFFFLFFNLLLQTISAAAIFFCPFCSSLERFH
jgi:hypothetical protein